MVGRYSSVAERSTRNAQVRDSIPRAGLLGRRRDGVVNVADLKSAPFGGAGSNPAGVLSFVVFSRFAGEASSILASGLFCLPG